MAGLALAAPAAMLPFITVEKFGNFRTGDFVSSVTSLNAHGMPFLAIWVALCGGIVPLLLLAVLACGENQPGALGRASRVLSHWAMPEVFVLGVFIALTRLGSLVEVELNAGFWSYVAMSLALACAWRAHRLKSRSHSPA